MLKRILVILLTLSMSAAIAAPDTRAGFRLGAGNYTLLGVNNEFTTLNTGWGGTLGLFMLHNISTSLFFQPAVILAWKNFAKVFQYQQLNGLQKGTMSYAINADGEATEDISLGYIQIPVLLRYELPVEWSVKPSLMIGPSFAFNISGKDNASGFGSWDGEHDIGNLKTFDFSGMVGAGVLLPVGNMDIGFDVIYDRSFASAFSDVSEEELAKDVNEELWTKSDPQTFERTTEAVDYKNSGFSFQFSMLMPLGL